MLGDILDFNLFHGEEVLKGIRDDPERLLLGAVDPAGGKLWGEVLGEDYEPLVNVFGGATDAQYDKADARGMETGDARKVGKVADTIAGIWGGAGALGGLGNAFGSMAGGGGGNAGGLYANAQTGLSQGGLYGNAQTGGLASSGGGGLMQNMDFSSVSNMMQGGGQPQQQPQGMAPSARVMQRYQPAAVGPGSSVYGPSASHSAIDPRAQRLIGILRGVEYGR